VQSYSNADERFYEQELKYLRREIFSFTHIRKALRVNDCKASYVVDLIIRLIC